MWSQIRRQQESMSFFILPAEQFYTFLEDQKENDSYWQNNKFLLYATCLYAPFIEIGISLKFNVF
jgi:hypothetical protein